MISQISQNQLPYFQSQKPFMNDCGVCALNNLIGCPMYDAKDLTNICNSLSNNFINPYKSIFGGDFDVSALILALNHLQLDVRWMKKDQLIQDVLSADLFKGILINMVDQDYRTIKKILQQSGKHWTCIKKIKDKFYYFDSKQKQPKRYDQQADVENLLEAVRQSGGILLIVQYPKSHTLKQQHKQQPKEQPKEQVKSAIL